MPQSFDFVESALPEGLSVIEASAGTGKTFAISHLVPRFLLEGIIASLGEILIVTFTNDAARELAERIRRVLEKLALPAAPGEAEQDPGIWRLRQRFGEEHCRRILPRALSEIDQLNVSTIHAFCQRTLQTEGTLCGLPVMPEVITHAQEIMEEALYDLWLERIAGDPMLATIATRKGWSIQADLKFVKEIAGLENFEPVPCPARFADTLEALKTAPLCFTHGVVNELVSFIGTIPETAWKKSGAARQQHLDALAQARQFHDPGFEEALEWIATLPDHIARRGKDGAARCEAAKTLNAVKRAGEITVQCEHLQWCWQNECAGVVLDRVQAKLNATRQITQDGLITTLRDALRGPSGFVLAARLRARIKVALIDESQDTDPKQFEIFHTLFASGKSVSLPHRLVMIGDPKQAIYGFRGADVNTYLAAKEQARATFTLNTTFRQPAPLVEALNAFFTTQPGMPGSLLKEGLEFYPASSGLAKDQQLFVENEPVPGRIEAWIVGGAEVESYANASQREEIIPATVATEIVRLLACGKMGADAATARPLTPSDFSVLTHSNAEAQQIAAALIERGVPAIIASGENVLASEEARELLHLLRALDDPRRQQLIFTALATRLLGSGVEALRNIQLDSDRYEGTLQKFLRWQQIWEHKGVAAALAAVDEEEAITPRLASTEKGERRLTNFRQLIDILQEAALQHAPRPAHLIRWFAQEIAAAGGNDAPEERQLQLESDREAVQVVTMHKAKGLEYNLVFCPYLWELKSPKGIQRFAQPGRRPQLVHLGLESGGRLKNSLYQNTLEDRLRLTYVAMTRAKTRLWFYGGDIGVNTRSPLPASPLDWLLQTQTQPEFTAAWMDNPNKEGKKEGRAEQHTAGLRSRFQGRTALIAIQPPPPANSASWTPPATSASPGLAALPVPTIARPWALTSFSALTRERLPHGSCMPPDPSREEPGQDVAECCNPFHAASGGTIMGTAIHAWMEQWDFGPVNRDALERHLQPFQLTAPPAISLNDAVAAMLEQLRGSMLPGLDCSIAQACPEPAASEWHFHLPIRESLTPQQLADVFRLHAAPLYQPYVPILGALPSAELRGFLQGFIDRLACEGNRWGVIDWKTNKLGQTPHAYSQAALLGCAMESHYILQAHLYLIALRRYLRQCNPAGEIAGAWLVFLRAVRSGTSGGILHIAPGEALLDALDHLFFPGQPADLP